MSAINIVSFLFFYWHFIGINARKLISWSLVDLLDKSSVWAASTHRLLHGLLVMVLLSLHSHENSLSKTESCSLEGAVRIANTTSFGDDFAGRVEVCYNGVWGTIGTDGVTLWHEKNAQVACRAAGFDGAINSIYTSG